MAAAKPGGIPQAFHIQTNGISNSHESNGSTQIQSWPSGHKIPGMTPVAGQNGTNFSQQLRNFKQGYPI
ncbi:uncharacterized protein A4U43_C05F30 [Asparagus officinalis]|uniref:Uncharacterized protein n=1 Tax=Asparagus officinalis TaxID=4686 RepID=A0A5P1EQN6_ASPOF|nr:uncharacterized protein A4U43_C05F30 [Asparagus officinalis]